MFCNASGAAIVSTDEWMRARQFLPGGRASRLLARRWLEAGGLPARFRGALEGSDLHGLRLERATVGHHGRVPGVEGHGGEVVGDAAHPSGDVLIAVDAALDEPLGGGESAWLQRSGAEARRARRAEAAARVGVPAVAVPDGAWPMLHRILATVDEAARRGRPRALVAVHSFLPDPSRAGSGFGMYRALGAAIHAREAPAADVPWRGPDIGRVALWLLWVTDDWAALQGVRRTPSQG